MNPSRNSREGLRFARIGFSDLARQRLRTGVPVGAVVIALAAALAIGGEARAADECGPPQPGVEIRCTPSDYNAAEHGNIFYGAEVSGGDFSIWLVDDLAVAYDRDAPDDDLQLGGFDSTGLYRYGAVVVVPGDSAHRGDIAVSSSSADVTSTGTNARGYIIGHIGVSGRIRMELEGGSVTTQGDNPVGILGFHGTEGDISAALRGTAIGAEGDDGVGVWLRHTGTGDLVISAEGGSVDAKGGRARGIFSDHIGTGNSTVDLRDLAVSVSGEAAYGIFDYRAGEGDSTFTLRDVSISASGNTATGIRREHFGNGDQVIGAEGGRIDGLGGHALGILGYHGGAGRNTVELRDVAISAEGDGAVAVRLQHAGTGDIGIVAEGGSVEAKGLGVDGIFGHHSSEGGTTVDLRDVAISAEGDGAVAVRLQHTGTGDIGIVAEGGSVEARGLGVDGIIGHHGSEGTGDIAIHLRGTTVTASGQGASGIEALHETGKGSIRIRVEGGTVHAEDPAGVAVQVGELDEETGAVVFGAGVGADGYRRQSVMVNGQVRGGSGDGAGIRLAGGGRVEIGPRGSVGAASGAAVRALGDGAALHVGADFDGRRAGDVIDGEILNEGGRTTIAVNRVTLHDGMAGATGLWAPNGARDVTLVAADAVAGRAFSTADFVTGPYAPRAAVYEALPGFLLRLDGRGTAVGRLREPGSPAWVRVFGGEGTYGSDRSSVGASYDFDRFGVEAGLDAALSPAGDVTGSVSLHHARGSADVSAPTGGGSIEAEGIGAALGATWRDAAGYHGMAASRSPATRRTCARAGAAG